MKSTPRRYPRFKTALPVELKPLDLQVPLRGQAADISWGGLYVEMTYTQQVSTKVQITLWAGDKKIRARGVVVSNHPAFGNGVKFTEVADSDREELKRLLESLASRTLGGQGRVKSSGLACGS